MSAPRRAFTDELAEERQIFDDWIADQLGRAPAMTTRMRTSVSSALSDDFVPENPENPENEETDGQRPEA